MRCTGVEHRPGRTRGSCAGMQDGQCLPSDGHFLTMVKRERGPWHTIDGRLLTKDLCRVNDMLDHGTLDGQSLRMVQQKPGPWHTFSAVCALSMSRQSRYNGPWHTSLNHRQSFTGKLRVDGILSVAEHTAEVVRGMRRKVVEHFSWGSCDGSLMHGGRVFASRWFLITEVVLDNIRKVVEHSGALVPERGSCTTTIMHGGRAILHGGRL